MANDRFTFLAAYLEDAKDMTAEEKAEYYDSIADYGILGIEPENFEHQIVKLAFRHAKRMIDEGNSRRDAGSRGGKQTASKPEANPKQTASKPEANPKQTASKPEANCKQTSSKPEANVKQTESKVEANPKQTATNIKDKSINIKDKIESKSEIENIQEIKKMMDTLSVLTPSTKKIPLSEALNNNISISP